MVGFKWLLGFCLNYKDGIVREKAQIERALGGKWGIAPTTMVAEISAPKLPALRRTQLTKTLSLPPLIVIKMA